MAFTIKRQTYPLPPSPLLMALISIHFLPHFFSFAIESYYWNGFSLHLVPLKTIIPKSP